MVLWVLWNNAGFAPLRFSLRNFQNLLTTFYETPKKNAKKSLAVWRYNESMARKSRYGVEIADRIVEYISLGYTLQDTARTVGVSDETIRRWRNRHADFNKRVVEASNRQWERPETLVKYKNPSYRSYRRRKIALSPDYGAKTEKDQSSTEKPLLEPLKPAKPQFICGLPVRPETVKEWAETPRYYNASNGMVEWIDMYPPTGRLVFHRCTLDAYKRTLERERLRREAPFIMCVA